MGIGFSIFLIAAGAILAWGIDVVVEGVDLDVIGFILMAVGFLGLLASMFIFGGPVGGRRRVVRERGPGGDEVVREERDYVR